MTKGYKIKAVHPQTACLFGEEGWNQLATTVVQLFETQSPKPFGFGKQGICHDLLFDDKYEDPATKAVDSASVVSNAYCSDNKEDCFLGMQRRRTFLFSPKEDYLLTHTARGKSICFSKLPYTRQRIMRYENMHLMDGIDFVNGIPIVAPYNGQLDFAMVPFTERAKHSGVGEALHFFLYDYKFVSVWNRLEEITHSIYNYEYLFAPDFSLYADDDRFRQINRQNVYRSRFVAAYWQKCGYQVIPTASWGDVNSFSYCFEGLPEHSVIAVCGIGHGQCKAARTLWHLAIAQLIEEKRPTTLIVYGGKEEDALHIPVNVKYIPDFINIKLRKL